MLHKRTCVALRSAAKDARRLEQMAADSFVVAGYVTLSQRRKMNPRLSVARCEALDLFRLRAYEKFEKSVPIQPPCQREAEMPPEYSDQAPSQS
jgi:hypothetical protein